LEQQHDLFCHNGRLAPRYAGDEKLRLVTMLWALDTAPVKAAAAVEAAERAACDSEDAAGVMADCGG
jgi:hypothetical protein